VVGPASVRGPHPVLSDARAGPGSFESGTNPGHWFAGSQDVTPTIDVGTFEPYGQWRTHLAAYNDTAEVQDNATRVGINFRTRGTIKMFVGTEWGVNLVQSATQFNL
jgi:hypothetical protein